MPSRLSNIMTGKTGALAGQGLRYLIAGGLAFAVDFALLKTFTDYIGINYILSAAIAFTVGLFITYVLSITWIFDRRKLDNRWAEFLVFAGIGGVGIGLTSLFIWIFTDLAGIHYLVSKVITTVIVTLWNFAAKKVLLF